MWYIVWASLRRAPLPASWCRTATSSVNGNVVNIPSYSLKVGDIVSVREKSKSLEVIVGSLAGGSKSRYAWLEWDGAAMAGKFLQRPEREEIPENIKEQLIVELYSK